MKKNKILSVILILIIGLSFTNCEDITSENNTRTASFETLEELLSGRLPSIYANLRSRSLFSQGGIAITWSDAGIDTHGGSLFPAEWNPFHNYTYGPGEIIIEQTWAEFYSAIKNVNSFIGQVREIEGGDDELRANLIAQARFLRGLLYFEMVKIWRNVPLIVSEDLSLDTVLEDSEAPNIPAEQTYLQIISDLEFAKANLPVTTSNDLASGAAAQTLLGKVYLQMTTPSDFGGVEGGIDADGSAVSVMTRYQQAKTELSGILGLYQLEDNYATVFSAEAENSNSEVIFAVGFETGPVTGSDWGDVIGPWGNNRHGGGFSSHPINLNFAFQYLLPDNLVSDTDLFMNTNGVGLYPLPNNEFFVDGTNRLSDPVKLLGFENFVSDARFEHNVARFHAQNLADFALGNQTFNPLALFNNEELLNTGRWQPWKFHKPNPNPNQGGEGELDFPYLRYADVLLMMAEIENELVGPNAAVPFVNEVALRSLKDQVLRVVPDLTGTSVSYTMPTAELPGTPRAELQPFIDSNLESVNPDDFVVQPEDLVSKDAMLDRILLERAKELCFEGKRKEDLIRTGKLTEVVNGIAFGQVLVDVLIDDISVNYNQNRHINWPIPFREISLNPNLKQNCAFDNSNGECF